MLIHVFSANTILIVRSQNTRGGSKLCSHENFAIWRQPKTELAGKIMVRVPGVGSRRLRWSVHQRRNKTGFDTRRGSGEEKQGAWWRDWVRAAWRTRENSSVCRIGVTRGKVLNAVIPRCIGSLLISRCVYEGGVTHNILSYFKIYILRNIVS